MAYHSGRHFLQIPGPTNVPGRVLRAIAAPTIDHRGRQFAELAREVIAGAGWLCGTSRPVALYPSSGTGAWEAALVNTLSPGDRVAAIDTARHPALLIVDAISSLGSIDYRHDEWGVDVTIWCSQKDMMLPPGLGLNAISEKALHASHQARLPRSYWEWEPLLAAAGTGLFPYTPATNLLFGLREALAMFTEEGLPAVFARHARHAEATRRAVRGWGLEILCQNPDDYSSTLTAVMLPAGHDADQVRQLILDRYNMSLGAGLGHLAGRVFRIGHLGDLGELSLAGALCGVEMGLAQAGVPIARDGVSAALGYLGSAG